MSDNGSQCRCSLIAASVYEKVYLEHPRKRS